MLKIVFIVKYYYPLRRPSGVLRFAMNLAEKLANQVDLTVVTRQFDKNHPAGERFKNYTIRRTKFPFYLTSAIETARLKPDVVIFGTGMAELYCLYPVLSVFKIFYKLSAKYFSASEASFYLYQFVDLNYKLPFLTRYICGSVEKVFCANVSISNCYSRNCEKSKIEYLPPGVDLSNLARFGAEPRKEGKRFKVGFFGHLDHRKGSDILVRSFLKLNNENMELFLAGLGSYKEDYESVALRHKNITVRGYLENVEAEIRSCDLLVFPYRHSDKILGLSLSAIEGLAFGKPLIVSDNNCLRDLVESGVNGYIFRSEDELSEHLNEVFLKKEKRDKFAAESLKKSKEFDINTVSDKLINIIKKDVENKR